MKLPIATCLLLILTSCSSVPLTKEEESVRILRKSDAPAECVEVGRVHAPGYGSITEEGRDADLKRAAFMKGGDTVTITNRDENNTIYGVAFKCKK